MIAGYPAWEVVVPAAGAAVLVVGLLLGIWMTPERGTGKGGQP